jgi:hypothetical protein
MKLHFKYWSFVVGLSFYSVFFGESIHFVGFDNKSSGDYILYQRNGDASGAGGPVFTAEAAGWVPMLVLKASEKGKIKVLLRDDEGFGVQLKLAPKMKGLSTYYLKNGIKISGDCGAPWFEGPFAVNVVLTEDALSEPFEHYEKVQFVRCCVYRNGDLTAEIYDDGIKLVDYHNMKVLDSEKITVARLKGEAGK